MKAETRLAIQNHYDFIMSDLLREGKEGAFALRKTTIPEGTVLNIYDQKAGRIRTGKYDFPYPIILLEESGNIWMSDSQLEVGSAMGAVEVAKGNVLIGGLGIGLLPTLIEDKVASIDIVELHQEVINLVFHQIATPKMRVFKDNIFHYLKTTGKRYDFIHIDIWGSTTAPMQQIGKARQMATRCLKPDGIIWCWLQELYDNIKDRLPKSAISQTQAIGMHDPCLICGKVFRNDYAGLCMDCADSMGLSEMFLKKAG